MLCAAIYVAVQQTAYASKIFNQTNFIKLIALVVASNNPKNT